MWETIESPLMLSVAALAYHDVGISIGTTATSTNPRERLWSTYVRAMLSRRRDDQHPPAQTIRSLAIIAGRLRADDLSFFSLDLLTEKWLLSPSSTVFSLLPVPVGAIIAALVLGLLGGVLVGWLGLVWAAVNVVFLAIFIALSHTGGSFLGEISYTIRIRQGIRKERRSIVALLHILDEGVRYLFIDVFESLLSLLAISTLPAGVVGLVFGLSMGLWVGVAISIGEAVSIFAFSVVLGLLFNFAWELSFECTSAEYS